MKLRSDEPVVLAVPKCMQNEFDIHHRFESCEVDWYEQKLEKVIMVSKLNRKFYQTIFLAITLKQMS